jgi:kynureninase
MKYDRSLQFANEMDDQDPLKSFRSEFHIPQHNGSDMHYFAGNSLGLEPKSAKKYIDEELSDWQHLAVDGHFDGRRPWMHYHKFSKESLARLVGANPTEVVAMNNLSVNLHLLLVSFYQPTKEKFKIIIEAGAFPSDQYIVETQATFHGYDPKEAIIELRPANGQTLRLEEILEAIESNKDSVALILLGGVQYYTGQFFDIPSIAERCQKSGIPFGLDLAHAIGNVPLQLHDDGVDFASWCSYKYLNSGPGNSAGIFVHEKHASSNLRRFGGWWGHKEEVRFKMEKGFIPMEGADGWQLSNVNVLSTAAMLASLEIFDRAGMPALRAKSMQLTGYLEFLVSRIPNVKILTPSNPDERGCQLSLSITSGNGKEIFNQLTEQGILVDWREPDVIRAAPVPLYNTFNDVYRLGETLEKQL